jgi:thiamine pyrophosphate-dependent acetolactate synthase large subunit-like protein
MKRLHEIVAATLVAHRTDVVFGLMGDANMLFLTDLMQTHGVRYVAAVDERNAALMAYGYAMSTGRVGVVSVTHGPALTHMATALVEAVRARASLLVLTGDTPTGRHLQALDIGAFVLPTGAGYERVTDAKMVSRDLARAYRRTEVERRPVVVNIPFGLLQLDVDDVLALPPEGLVHALPADDQVIDDALGLIVSSTRPVLLAGRGAVSARARDAITGLADFLGVPLATSLLGKDSFHGHPLNLGVCGTISTPVASQRITNSDCVVAFGASLNRYTTDSGHLIGAAQRVVQVDSDSAALGRHTRVAKPIVGDAGAVAEQMLARLREASEPIQRDSAQLKKAITHQAAEVVDAKASPGFVDLRRALSILDGLLPASRNLVTDTGRSMRAPWRYLRVDEALGFVPSSAFASIGLGLGTAIGVAVARPDRPTVAAVGDGGFMQALSELQTAVREHLKLVVVVANDSAYGAEWRKLERYGRDPQYARSSWGDIVKIAAAIGADAYRIADDAALLELKSVLADVTAPVVLELVLDPRTEPMYA